MKDKLKESLLSKAAASVYIVSAALIIIMLGYLLFSQNISVINGRAYSDFEIVSDYTCRETESKESPIGIKKEYTFVIPDNVRRNTYFAFYTVHQYTEAYIGDELVYSLKPSKSNKIGKTVGSNWIMFPIYREDYGKELRIEITPVYESFRDRETEFLAGSQIAIYTHRLKKDLPQIILGVMTVLVGITFIIIAAYNLIKRKKGGNLADLGVLSLMIGIWRLTDTRFTPFAVPEKPVFLFYTSVSMLMIGMIPLIRSIYRRFNKISIRIFDIYCIAAGTVCLIQLALQIFNVMDIRDSLLVTHIMIFIGILTIIFNIIYDHLRLPKNERLRYGYIIPVVCIVGAAADVASFYVRNTSSGLIFTLLAFLLCVIFSGIMILIDYQRQENLIREQKVILADSRISTLISRIQPHFIFNSLTAIKHLCKKNPKEAQEAIENFSFFLRGSIDALSLKECVTFEHELEITKNYLYLEKKRFGDKLNIEYDIKESGFLIPALSVQPIVENAIRHGIRKKSGKGCVKISTYKDGGDCLVKISDDGIGFDTEKQGEDGKLHVGLSNVKNRLKLMCGGTLDVSSTPGKGTEVIIRIPRVNR